MKLKFSSGFITDNNSVVNNFFTTSFLNPLIGLILFFGILATGANAQQDSVVLTSGSTWVIPTNADISSITVECWGAGGGGAYSSIAKGAGGAGGGGAYAKRVFTSFTTGQTINYEIGVGGSGTSGTNAGGKTWFSENTTTGVAADGGRGAVDNSMAGATGGNASSSFGDIIYNGGKGGNGSFSTGEICGNEQASGGGGAAATSTSVGTPGGNASTSTGGLACLGNHSTAGLAGSNLLFFGYSSNGGVGVTSGTGNMGFYGGGGSGAVKSTYNGGNGGNGFILITYDTLCFATKTNTEVACKSFTWIDGIEYTASTTTATHIIPGVAANGCDSLITLNLTINNPDLTITQTDGINLSSNAIGATYQWIACNNGNAPIANATDQDFTAIENGSYAVVVTKNGCTDTSACIVVDNVGLKDFKEITGISLFPNPTRGLVTVKLDNKQDGQYSLEIIDATGRLLNKQMINSNSTKVDLTNYERGLYIILISNEENQSIYRVIKE